MGERAGGQALELDRKGGRTFALRFRAYGKRRYLTLGTVAEGWSRAKAEDELANVLADVRRGIWRPFEPPQVSEPAPTPTFHEFASEWFDGLVSEGLAENTLARYRWELSNHLLPFFARHRLSRSRSPRLIVTGRRRSARRSCRPLRSTTRSRAWRKSLRSPSSAS